jgi:hypothetical protein
MKRAPIYVDKQSYRIVSRPNGLWQVQEFYGKCSKTFDAWSNLRRAADFDAALNMLKALSPVTIARLA